MPVALEGAVSWPRAPCSHQASAQGTQSPSLRHPHAPQEKASLTNPRQPVQDLLLQGARGPRAEKGPRGREATGPALSSPQVDGALRQDPQLQVTGAPRLGVGLGQVASRWCGSQRVATLPVSGTHRCAHAGQVQRRCPRQQGCPPGHTQEIQGPWEPAHAPERRSVGSRVRQARLAPCVCWGPRTPHKQVGDRKSASDAHGTPVQPARKGATKAGVRSTPQAQRRPRSACRPGLGPTPQQRAAGSG